MKTAVLLKISIVILSGAGFVLADYFAVFGTNEKTEMVLQEVKFRPLNQQTNSPIIGARIRCFQAGGKKDVCYQVDSGKLGIVSVKIPRSRQSENSLLFEQSFRYTSNGSTQLHVMLMHLDYGSKISIYDSDELFKNSNKVYDVLLQFQDYGDADDD